MVMVPSASASALNHTVETNIHQILLASLGGGIDVFGQNQWETPSRKLSVISAPANKIIQGSREKSHPNS